jgi:hypothetical protein
LRQLRIYLLIADGGDIKSELFSDLDLFLPRIQSLIKAGPVTGLVYIGFDRPANSDVLLLLNSKPDSLFFSSSAKIILEKYFNVSFGANTTLGGNTLYQYGTVERPITPSLVSQSQSSSFTLPNQASQSSLPQGNLDLIIPNWVVRGNSFTWFKDFAMQDEASAKTVTACGIVNDITYQALERQLDNNLRIRLARHRAAFLKDLLRFNQIQDYCKIIPPWGLEIPVTQFRFSVRTANRLMVLGINNVGDFSSFSNETLMKAPGFGRKCLTEVRTELSDQLKSFLISPGADQQSVSGFNASHTALVQPYASEVPGSDTVQTFLPTTSIEAEIREADTFCELLVVLLKCIKKTQADVLEMRLGLVSEDKTLQQVGEVMGVTRERVRQMESVGRRDILSVLDLREMMRERLDRIRDGMEIPLLVQNLSNYDSWFNGIEDRPWLIDNFFGIFGVGTYRVHKFDNLSIVSLGDSGFLDTIIRTTRDFVKNSVKDGISRAVVRKRVSDFVSATTPELIEFIFAESVKNARFIGEPPNDKLVSYGLGIDSSVAAILHSSDVPLRVEQVTLKMKNEFGQVSGVNQVRNSCASMCFLYAPSTFGFRKHLELSDEEIASVAEYAVDLLEAGTKGRQWHSREILAEIPEFQTEFSLPLNQYTLGICLELSGKFNCLGRMVYSLRDEHNSGSKTKRIEFSQFIEAVLDRSPTPMKSDEIIQQVSNDRGLSSFSQILPLGRIVSTDRSTWGLLDKHLGLSDRDYAVLVEEVVSILRAKGIGLTEEELVAELPKDSLANRFSDNPYIIFALCTKSKKCKKDDDFLYLREWDEPRRMTMRGAVLQVISSMPSDGLAIKDIVSKTIQLYGKDLVKENIYTVMRNTGAIYDEDTGTWRYTKEDSAEEN